MLLYFHLFAIKCTIHQAYNSFLYHFRLALCHKYACKLETDYCLRQKCKSGRGGRGYHVSHSEAAEPLNLSPQMKIFI